MLMPSKRYESTEVDRRTWLHVPSGTHWSTHQVVELLLRCIWLLHHFKSDLYSNMDHMRISGTEPSSVILSQKESSFKCCKLMSQKCQKQTEVQTLFYFKKWCSL